MLQTLAEQAPVTERAELDVSAEVDRGIAQIEAALADGTLTVPEGLVAAKGEFQKIVSGPDTRQQGYKSPSMP